jgi:hypothetical protein
MYELWPDRAWRPAPRMDAMMAVGTVPIAIENWRLEYAAHPLTHHIDQAFDVLDHKRSDDRKHRGVHRKLQSWLSLKAPQELALR